MINKEEELIVVCSFDEAKMSGTVKLEDVRKVIFDYV